ncbi:hypothetical protein CDL15_Pgr005121 [Punica granatum]|uniref:Uncharacterized protein n=1 Tax=Punica granatum TaxID=22663 RepID=A0A218WRF1_PUNGR|nr:hypothetical protein CDL15_Pgr005121 [Punica granatum]PKI52244.1 hypothetical protein CRG98_027364 [Punica granatum]
MPLKDPQMGDHACFYGPQGGTKDHRERVQGVERVKLLVFYVGGRRLEVVENGLNQPLTGRRNEGKICCSVMESG